MAKHLALELEPDVAEALDAFAASTERSPSEIVNEMLRARLAHAAALTASISRGVEQLDRDDSLTTEQAHHQLAILRAKRS